MSAARLGLICRRPPAVSEPWARILEMDPDADGSPDLTPSALRQAWMTLAEDESLDGWLTWLPSGPCPDEATMQILFAQAGDIWHGGLGEAFSSSPKWLTWVSPSFMHGLDPHEGGTNWRISLARSLVRRSAVVALGPPSELFESSVAAGLELGFRYLRNGAVVRSSPSLALREPASKQETVQLSPEDEVSFLALGVGKKWARWAVGWAFLGGELSPLKLPSLLRRIRNTTPHSPSTYASPSLEAGASMARGTVTVLIPTIDRYPYLETVLSQLAQQTRPPDEIVVIDQTPQELRRDLRDAATPVPVVWLEQEQAGQCSSRNYGLRESRGDFILFLDDDDEVENDLVERHLKVLSNPAVDVSSGVAEELEAGPLPADFRFARVSGVFPTNNTMVRRPVLEEAGLFDLAYDRGQRADGDLGMRVHQTGALMALRPEISVLHHHAPMGGLRTHRARVTTYGQSRAKLTVRALPTASDFYLAARYFGLGRWKAISRLGLLGTFRLKGPRWAQVAKVFVALLFLPDSLLKLARARHQARRLLEQFPDIPRLEEK